MRIQSWIISTVGNWMFSHWKLQSIISISGFLYKFAVSILRTHEMIWWKFFWEKYERTVSFFFVILRMKKIKRVDCSTVKLGSRKSAERHCQKSCCGKLTKCCVDKYSWFLISIFQMNDDLVVCICFRQSCRSVEKYCVIGRQKERSVGHKRGDMTAPRRCKEAKTRKCGNGWGRLSFRSGGK